MLYSFPPLINSKTRVLVVGSMPGAASLKALAGYLFLTVLKPAKCRTKGKKGLLFIKPKIEKPNKK